MTEEVHCQEELKHFGGLPSGAKEWLRPISYPLRAGLRLLSVSTHDAPSNNNDINDKGNEFEQLAGDRPDSSV